LRSHILPVYKARLQWALGSISSPVFGGRRNEPLHLCLFVLNPFAAMISMAIHRTCFTALLLSEVAL